MAPRCVDKLVWKALTDTTFCEGLLNGKRREVLETLDFTEEERKALMAVRADTLESFAGELCQAGFLI